MTRGSSRFTVLKRRVDDLARRLLSFLPPPPASKTTYTPKEIDLTCAFVVLVHAEIEEFCEEIVTEKAKKALGKSQTLGRTTPVLRRIVAFHVGKEKKSWSEVLSPSPLIVESASNSYFGAVRENHGVKRKNLEHLLYPLGMTEPQLDPTWLVQMDSFGSARGRFAHKSIRAFNPPDPYSELTNVKQLLNGLLLLDRMLSRLR